MVARFLDFKEKEGFSENEEEPVRLRISARPDPRDRL